MAFGDYGLYYKLPRHVWIPAIIVGGLLTLAAAAKMGTAKSCQLVDELGLLHSVLMICEKALTKYILR